MKKTFMTAMLLILFSFPLACTRELIEMPMAAGPMPTATPTPMTITVTINFGTLGSYTGFYYQAAGFTNDPSTGLLNLTARVGDTVQLPADGGHPLYFDPGSATCIYSNSTTNETYLLNSAGTYYFHCGFHGLSCTTTAGCGSTDCVGMAGEIVVSP